VSFAREHFAAYKALREKYFPYMSPDSALWHVRNDINNAIIRKLLPPEFEIQGIYRDAKFDVEDHTIKAGSKSFDDRDILEGFAMIIEPGRNSQGASQRCSEYQLQSGSYTILNYSEDTAYKDLRKEKVGKADARRRAIESRQRDVVYVENVQRGNIYEVDVFVECDDIDFWECEVFSTDSEDEATAWLEDTITKCAAEIRATVAAKE